MVSGEGSDQPKISQTFFIELQHYIDSKKKCHLSLSQHHVHHIKRHTLSHMIYENVFFSLLYLSSFGFLLYIICANRLIHSWFHECDFSFLGDINDDNKAARVHHTHNFCNVCIYYSFSYEMNGPNGQQQQRQQKAQLMWTKWNYIAGLSLLKSTERQQQSQTQSQRKNEYVVYMFEYIMMTWFGLVAVTSRAWLDSHS